MVLDRPPDEIAPDLERFRTSVGVEWTAPGLVFDHT
jgi:hypothetical protein